MRGFVGRLWRFLRTQVRFRTDINKALCHRTYEVWLGPVNVQPTAHGEPGLGQPFSGPIDPAQIDPSLRTPFGITGFTFELHARPKSAADPDNPIPDPRAAAALPRADTHLHRIHLHHVKVEKQSGEAFAGAGHEQQPVLLPDPYFYRVEPNDMWQFSADVRNVHVDPADLELDDPAQEGPDQPWVVSLKWTIYADRCIDSKPDKNVLPVWISVTRPGGTRYDTFSVPPQVGEIPPNADGTQPVLPAVAADIKRQDGLTHHGVDCVEVVRDLQVPFRGTIVHISGHLHVGAADMRLYRVDQAGAEYQLAGFSPVLGGPPADHPLHITDIPQTFVGPIQTQVYTNGSFRVRARYSKNLLTRDQVRANGQVPNGSNYDYNNTFEQGDVMAIVVLAVNPSRS